MEEKYEYKFIRLGEGLFGAKGKAYNTPQKLGA